MYLEGSLSSRVAARVASHIDVCIECRRQERMLVLLAEAVGSLPAVRCRPTFTTAVLRRARVAEGAVVPRRNAWGLRLAVAGAAAAVAAVVMFPRIHELARPGGAQPSVASRQSTDEFVLPFAGAEERLVRRAELGSWPPAEGRVHVRFVLDQNMTPRAARDDVYVLDRAAAGKMPRQQMTL